MCKRLDLLRCQNYGTLRQGVYLRLLMAVSRDGVKDACLAQASVSSPNTASFSAGCLKCRQAGHADPRRRTANSHEVWPPLARFSGASLAYVVASHRKAYAVESVFAMLKNIVTREMASRD